MANKVKYGLSNVYYAKATIDPSTGAATYDTPVAIKGAVNLSLDPQGELSPFYADNIKYYTVNNNSGYEGDLEIALIPDSFRKDILGEVEDDGSVINRSVATGKLAKPLLSELAQEAMKRFPSVKINVYEIKNEFFGETITVAGLITGKDLISQLTPYKSELGDALLIPKTMLKADEPLFLDNVTVSDAEKALGVSIVPVGDEPEDLIEAMLG